MARLFLLVVFYYIIIFCSAQQNKIDSLINTLPAITDKYKKSKTLNNICLKLVYINPDSALKFGQRALEIGKDENDNLIKGESFNRIGIVYDVKNVWDSALIFYDSALLCAVKANDSITIASAYNNIGLVYWNKSIYDKAIDNFFKSLKLFEKLGKKRGVANTYNNIGLILMEQDRDSSALQYQFSSLKIREEISDEYGINDSRLNIALLYWSLKKYDSSAYYYKRAIPFYIKTDNHYALGTAFNGLAMVYEDIHKPDSALFYYNKAINEHLEVQNFYKAASSLLNKAHVYNQSGDTENELNILLKAKSLLDDESSIRVRSKILFQLAELYNKNGQYKKASELYLEFKAIDDSLYNVDRDEKIEQIKVKYETEKKEKALLKEKAENERLQKEKALTEIRLYNRNKWIIGIIGASLILIFFILFISQRNKRKAQAEKDSAIIMEREKGLKAVFNAQEEERKRIAKDLHDGIGQQISAIKMYFQNFAKGIIETKPELKEDILKVEKMVTDTGTDIRNISHQMMPKALLELGLVDALEDLLENSFFKTNVKYSFETFGLKKRLPSNVEIALYRIAQELFNNIIKHSGAKKVDVQLMKMESHCILIVRDDGRGIPESEASYGIGMLNINNRLSTINGNLNMDSGKGKGTTATIRIGLA
ncbi:MAG: tetratricopeptide repeat protein [Bacteroidetes bacterium]|nr:tetratricopeptide repeat protein [Bacteroidota bacterium]MBL7104394.1 tetratricopeptide repeat protein [Bacteroidales bacterium]